MIEGKPFDPWQPYAPIARTVREVELEKVLASHNTLLAAALPYLISMQMDDTGDKLTELVEAIARETA